MTEGSGVPHLRPLRQLTAPAAFGRLWPGTPARPPSQAAPARPHFWAILAQKVAMQRQVRGSGCLCIVSFLTKKAGLRPADRCFAPVNRALPCALFKGDCLGPVGHFEVKMARFGQNADDFGVAS
eukprot:NODE_2562_length_1088_cov_98.114533_g2131_i0.p3 GENE.NODE_2562_length_1088_cov_98.114533_g2131_i0~~NODE_2562_length_1088_cov_98.114533_g2131_i0.p3  ORF type:complete len:125 (-),score=1.46 NODE_2562_length_1088_cov_98.114533_g2131_i0:51-425(-)